jgi:hypothetical protein
MSGSVQAVIDAIEEHIGGFDPQSRSELHGFFSDLPRVYRTLGSSLITASKHMTNRHVHADVLNMLEELGGVSDGVGEHADTTYTTHAKAHELWLTD